MIVSDPFPKSSEVILFYIIQYVRFQKMICHQLFSETSISKLHTTNDLLCLSLDSTFRTFGRISIKLTFDLFFIV
jgi:hypothetical protein